jgi:hypothetical protein
VVPDDASDVLKHEIGHVFGLPHINLSPLNLMCGSTYDASDFTQFMNDLICTSWLGTDLNPDQLNTAKAAAAQLEEQ